MMMELLRHLGRALGIGARRPIWVIAFVFGSVAIGLVGSGLFDLIVEWRGRSVGTLLWLTGGPLLVLTIVGSIFASFANRQRSATNPNQDDDEFPPYPVLIVFVSPGNNKSHVPAIDYHARKGSLRECYLIHTSESIENSDEVRRDFADDVSRIVPRLLDDSASVRSAFESVRAAIDHARIDGATSDEILVDITGGTKMMTAGAVLACASGGVAIQYTEGAYDKAGVLKRERPKLRRVLLSSEIERDHGSEPVSS
ncbi:MAG: hypothetical protein M3464_09460 [Chloroflexota bacterium]|nr:hypothetical protein [Chloroflexota bacterium]